MKYHHEEIKHSFQRFFKFLKLNETSCNYFWVYSNEHLPLSWEKVWFMKASRQKYDFDRLLNQLRNRLVLTITLWWFEELFVNGLKIFLIGRKKTLQTIKQWF